MMSRNLHASVMFSPISSHVLAHLVREQPGASHVATSRHSRSMPHSPHFLSATFAFAMLSLASSPPRSSQADARTRDSGQMVTHRPGPLLTPLSFGTAGIPIDRAADDRRQWWTATQGCFARVCLLGVSPDMPGPSKCVLGAKCGVVFGGT